MVLGWVVNSAMIMVAAAVFARHHVVVDSIEQASATLKPLAGPLAGLLFAVALVFAGVGSSVTSSMAEVNVITGFLGKPEDPKTLLYRISVFVTAIPSFLIIILEPEYLPHPDLQPGGAEHPAAVHAGAAVAALPQSPHHGLFQKRQVRVRRRRDYIGSRYRPEYLPALCDRRGRRLRCKYTKRFWSPWTARQWTKRLSEHVAALALQNKATVHLLHVVHSHTLDQDRTLREQAETALKTHLDACGGKGSRPKWC